LQARAYQSKLGLEERIAVLLVDSDRPAQDDKQIVASRLKILPCSDELTDAGLIGPAYGGLGLFGYDTDADSAYETFYKSALEHERATPQEPWVLTVHPFVSGNRAWHAFDKFMRRMCAEFGSSSFRTGRELALGD